MEILTMRLVTLVALCVFVPVVLGAPGDVDDPIVLHPGDTYTGSTVGRPVVDNACDFLGDFTGGAVYFMVESPPEYLLTLSTCSDVTDFDATIVAFLQFEDYGLFCEMSNQPLPCADMGSYYTLTNGDEQLSYMDELTFVLAVTGNGDAEGNFELSLIADIPDETWDECMSTLPLYGPQTFMGRVYPDGSGTPVCGIESTTSVAWYEYATLNSGDGTGIGPATTSRVVITTCSEDTDFDTILFMPSELMDCDSITCTEISDDYCIGDVAGTATGSTLVFDTFNEGYVTFGVVGKGSSSGVYRITITEEADELNGDCQYGSCGETCENPAPLPIGRSYVYFYSESPLAGVSLCGLIQPTDYIHWFQLNSPISTTLTITTCALDFFEPVDTTLALIDGCDEMQCITWNDDYTCGDIEGPSALRVYVNAHTTYWLAVSTYNNAEGSVAVTVAADLEES